MHHLIVYPESEKTARRRKHRLLRDQANKYFDAFYDGSDDDTAFEGRVRLLGMALMLARQARACLTSER